MPVQPKMDPETLSMILDTLAKLEKEKLTVTTKLELDQKGEFPMELARFMLGPEMALHLIFIPSEYGGLGAGAREIAIVSEKMAKIDLGIATSFLASCLGMDPIRVGSTPAQKEKYITRVAEKGFILAYGATEPEAGSNVQALKTKAERVLDETGKIQGYRINGQKQFITNAGVADLYTILANTPDGPSFFIVEAGTPGLIPGKHEDKHGIRASDTCPITLEDLYVPVENLVGGIEGQGLKQANEVFGYTRLMVATFGLGGGMAALEKTIAYAKQRIQFGTPLVEKQGYTHKLLVPNAVRLEAARAYIEQVGERIDAGEEGLEVEGSIAKYFATEAGDAMANDAIQGLGGYGYIREYEVEKIKRDVKITTIFEGTSEIQQSIIATFRLRDTVRSKGGYYRAMAESLEQLPLETGGPWLAEGFHVLNDLIILVRKLKWTKSQYVMFLLAEMMAWSETAHAFCHKSAGGPTGVRSAGFMQAASRLFVNEVMGKIHLHGLKILQSPDADSADLWQRIAGMDFSKGLSSHRSDMDLVAAELVR